MPPLEMTNNMPSAVMMMGKDCISRFHMVLIARKFSLEMALMTISSRNAYIAPNFFK